MFAIPEIRIRYNGARVRLVGAGMRKLQNLRLMEVGLDSIRGRLDKGIGQNDTPTAPLSKRYAIYKSKVTRRRALRDLRLTGELLDGLKTRYADDQTAVADASGRKGRIKARIYRELLLFSPNDQKVMSKHAEAMFRENVTQVFNIPSRGRLAGPGRQPARTQFQRDASTFARSA